MNVRSRERAAAGRLSTDSARVEPSSGARSRRPGRWLGRLAAVLAGLLLPLIMLEAALRLFGPILPGNYDTGAYLVRDEALGHFHVRGFSGWIKAPEFTTHVAINDFGLRDRRRSYEKPPGTFRIVLLGDSFVEAVQVRQSDGIAERLEAALNRDASVPIEVVNAGVAAYGTTQEYLLLDQMGEQLKPDLVLLLFFVGNDVTNNNYRLELWDGNLSLALKPYFDIERDGSLRLIPGPPPSPRHGFSDQMRRCCLLYNVIETGVYNKLDQNYPRETLEAVGGLQTPLTGLYDTQVAGEWDRAWRISEALLGRIRDRSKEMGATLVIAAAPDWLALDPAAWREELRRGNPSSNRLASGRRQITAPTDRLGTIADRLGVSYLNLLPTFQRAATDGTRLYFDFDKHWNPAGHQVAADAIEQALRAGGLTASGQTSGAVVDSR